MVAWGGNRRPSKIDIPCVVSIGTYICLQFTSCKLFDTDLGSLIGNFDCGHSTVWIFSNFPGTTLILREINFC